MHADEINVAATEELGKEVYHYHLHANLLEALPLKEQACREKLSDLHNQLETAKVEVQKPFPREEELKTKLARLEELNTLLNMDKHEPEVIGDTEMPKEQPPARKTTELER